MERKSKKIYFQLSFIDGIASECALFYPPVSPSIERSHPLTLMRQTHGIIRRTHEFIRGTHEFIHGTHEIIRGTNEIIRGTNEIICPTNKTIRQSH